MINTLKSNITKVNKIFQVSDIHIRIFKRKDEYEKVFRNLYSEISSRFDENSIIVITGDLFHNKLEMGPEQIELATDFLKSLANIGTTIIIAGNHDANLTNKNRLDCISPIVNAISHENIFYLKDTGLYKLQNIMFSNMSVFSDISTYMLASDFDFDGTKVALYHGTINNSSTDTGWKITNEKVETNMFDGFDFTLIGDIHKRQVLQRYEIMKGIKKPHIEYPGSLIQQNFGESVTGHGFLVWNVDNRDNEFISIQNEFGYVTIDIENGVIISGVEYVPEKSKMRIRVKDTSPEDLKSCISDIKSTYKPVEIIVNKFNSVVEWNETTKHINLSKIREVDFQNNLLKQYYEDNNITIDADLLSDIFKINKLCNSELPMEETIRNVTWKPKIFKFSNMFSYAEDNIIDFTKMKGLVGLFSANASGKCVDENTDIDIEFSEKDIIQKLGFLPDELK